jgi:hypothetical protein
MASDFLSMSGNPGKMLPPLPGFAEELSPSRITLLGS